MIRLRSERILTPAGTIAGEVAIEDGRIVDVRPRGATAGHRNDEAALELGDQWVAPGYIDLHVHGGGGAQCNTADPDEILAVSRFHAGHGTTALLATTVAAPVAELEAALKAIACCCAGRPEGAAVLGAAVLGAHLEGPFLSPRRPGAMDPGAFASPDPELLARLLGAGDGTVRLMTVAPELPGALELIGALAGAGVVASIGHTDATYAQTLAAVQAGARAATHVFNAMRPLDHREPGVLGAVLDLPEVSCELICDGIHVEPAVLRLAYRAKGRSGVTLVTDAMQAAGMPDGEYRLGATAVTVTGGRAVTGGGGAIAGQADTGDGGAIAGSTLTMDAAVRNAVRFLGVTVEQASALASANPARVVGLADRKGAVAAGYDADLVVLDDELRVRGTLVAGDWVLGPP
jgi:N-acetylglucosamine-6-phosphate deacetylase